MSTRILAVIRDIKSESYSPPVFPRTKGEAIRIFADEVNNHGNSQIAAHPADYQLFNLGTFDEQTAKVDLLKTPEFLAAGSDFVISKSDEDEKARKTATKLRVAANRNSRKR